MFREIQFFVTLVGHFPLQNIGDARNFGHIFVSIVFVPNLSAQLTLVKMTLVRKLVRKSVNAD